jgi:hypothetical protein
MGAIINNEQVAFVARNTNNWRGPQITMNYVKNIICMRCRTSKGHASMRTELTSVTKIMGAPRANDTRVARQLGQGVNTWVSKTVMPSRRRCS